MGPTGYPETSIRNYDTTLRNIPDERTSHLHRGGSLKTRKNSQFTTSRLLEHKLTFRDTLYISIPHRGLRFSSAEDEKCHYLMFHYPECALPQAV